MNEGKKKFPWLPMFALAFAYATAFNPPYIRYFLYDSMIEAMGCSNVQLSFLTTVSVITAFINSIPGGWVADRFNTKKNIADFFRGEFSSNSVVRNFYKGVLGSSYCMGHFRLYYRFCFLACSAKRNSYRWR